MKKLAFFLTCVVLILVAIGVANLASINHDDTLSKQATFLFVALIPATIILIAPLSFWTNKKMLLFMAVMILIALVSVHIPGLGHEVKGARRWIKIFGMQVQPSEIVKLAFVLILSWWMCGPARKIPNHKNRVLIPLAGLGVVAAGFIWQGDFGSVIMLSAVAIPLMLLGGSGLWILPYCAVAGALLLTMLMNNPERRSRIASKFSCMRTPAAEASATPGSPKSANDAKLADAQGDRYQVNQSLQAFKQGGKYGKGFGNSLFKLDYLPEKHTDFVLAIIGEEFGFIGTSVCLGLFFALFIAGLAVSMHAPDRFSAFVALGMTLHISLSAAVNISVVTDLVPPKGLALPFISSGGSNLICSIAAAAFIISICLRGKRRRNVVTVQKDYDGLMPT